MELKIKLLNELGLIQDYYTDEDKIETVKRFEKCGYLTENQDNEGNNWYWYLDNETEGCINLQGEIIEDKEEIRKLFNI